MQIRPFQIEDESALVDLWSKCELVRPVNDPVEDIRRKLAVNPEWFLVGNLRINPAKCIYHKLAVNPELERLPRAAGCPKMK